MDNNSKVSTHALSLRALNRRRLVAYPSEKNFKIFTSHCKENKYLRTELLVLLIDSYIERLPKEEKEKYLNI